MNQLQIRPREIAVFEKMLQSERAEFLALYGRRRVGKTYLVREFFGTRDDVFFFDVSGVKDQSMQAQLSRFLSRIADVFHDQVLSAETKNWDDALGILTKAISKRVEDQPIVLFFDEFPWMVTKNSQLLNYLDYYWNQHWSKDPRIKLIICGSSASWIIDKILNNRAGLHNRITRRIRLQPLKLKQVKAFLAAQRISLNEQQILTVYLAMGGVPYYLSAIERGESASQAIERLAFQSDGLLFSEFQNLFSSLFDEHAIYVDFIRLIAAHRYGLAQEDIFRAMDKKHKGKSGLHILKSLEEAGFIKNFKSYGRKRKGLYYRVIDEYTLFYLKWIEPIRDELSSDDFEEGYWRAREKTAAWHSWSGYAFEAVCYQHVREIKRALKLSPLDRAHTWWFVPTPEDTTPGAQIDLLFDREDNAISLCEIKYTAKPYVMDKATADALQRKAKIFAEKMKFDKQLFNVLISANGLKMNKHAEDISRIVTLEDFFA